MSYRCAGNRAPRKHLKNMVRVWAVHGSEDTVPKRSQRFHIQQRPVNDRVRTRPGVAGAGKTQTHILFVNVALGNEEPTFVRSRRSFSFGLPPLFI